MPDILALDILGAVNGNTIPYLAICQDVIQFADVVRAVTRDIVEGEATQVDHAVDADALVLKRARDIPHCQHSRAKPDEHEPRLGILRTNLPNAFFDPEPMIELTVESILITETDTVITHSGEVTVITGIEPVDNECVNMLLGTG
jgi:hypothetical protein